MSLQSCGLASCAPTYMSSCYFKIHNSHTIVVTKYSTWGSIPLVYYWFSTNHLCPSLHHSSSNNFLLMTHFGIKNFFLIVDNKFPFFYISGHNFLVCFDYFYFKIVSNFSPSFRPPCLFSKYLKKAKHSLISFFFEKEKNW